MSGAWTTLGSIFYLSGRLPGRNPIVGDILNNIFPKSFLLLIKED
jgi:hypothetical protein